MQWHLTPNLFHVLVRHAIRFKVIYVIALTSLVATHYIQSLLPFWAKELADLVSVGSDNISVLNFILLAVGIIVFRTSSRLLFFYPARIFQRDARLELLERVERSLPSRYSSYSAGQLFQVIHNDLDPIRALLGFVFLQIGNMIVATAILLPKLAAFSPDLLIALLPMLGAVVLFSIIVWRNKIFFRRTQDLQGDVQNFIIETYHGKKTIKTFQAEKSFSTLFSVRSQKELWNFYRARIGVSFSMPLIPLGVGLSLLLGAYIIKINLLGASSLILFSGFIFLFLEPIMFLSWIGVVLTHSLGAWDRVVELLVALETPTSDEQQLKDLNPSDSMIIRLPYWNHLLDLDLISSGIPVLIGKTGCGKSQLLIKLAKVLMNKGKKISLVEQRPYLYNDTIEKNIFLGKNPSEEERDQAFHLLNLFALNELGSTREQLLKLVVGENGMRLSGGQSKRVCLVRSLLSDANYLLWDDPFSSIDLILEREITANLKDSSWLFGRCLVLATHRLSTLKNCDQVFLVSREEGIIETGFVDELMAKDSKVNEYFKDQLV